MPVFGFLPLRDRRSGSVDRKEQDINTTDRLSWKNEMNEILNSNRKSKEVKPNDDASTEELKMPLVEAPQVNDR